MRPCAVPLVLLFAVVCFSCEGIAEPAALSSQGVSEGEELGGLGFDPQSVLANPQVARDRQALSSTPSAIDLTQFNPPVGDQGNLGSCVSWATGWSTMGWLARRYEQQPTAFAPMYLYSQLAYGNASNGTTLLGNFTILRDQGIDTWAHYTSLIPSLAGQTSPSAGYNFVAKPSAYPAVVQAAAAHRLSDWREEFGLGGPSCTAQPGASMAIKEALAAGRPVVLAIPVYTEFDQYRSRSAPIPVPAPTSTLRGYHAVFAAKYDATGLWIQNQWGTGWGQSGHALLSWAFVEKCTLQVASVAGLASKSTVPHLTLTADAGTTLTGVVGLDIASDESSLGFDLVQVRVDQTILAGLATRKDPSHFSFPLNTAWLASGAHSLTAVGVHSFGGATTTSAPLNVTVANAPPVSNLSISITSPTSGSIVRGAITVSASSAGQTAASISIAVDGAPPVITSGSSTTLSLNTATLPDGLHTIVAIASARDGATARATTTFTTDNTGPSVTLSTSPVGPKVSGNVTITATPAPGANDVALVRFFANQTLIAEVTPSNSATFATQWNTALAADGEVTLSAQALDALGNVGLSAPLKVTVANQVPPTGPTITILSPVGGSTLSGGVTVSLKIDDPAPWTQLQLFVDQQLAAQKTSGTADWYWNTAQVANGAHTLRATATDSLGRSFSSSLVTVSVLNQVSAFKALIVRASGTPVKGAYPVLSAEIGGVKLAAWTLSGTMKDYTAQVPTSLTLSDNIRLVFLNDAYSPPEDRNVSVEAITLGAQRLNSVDPTTYLFQWNPACGKGFLRQATLYCNGYFEFPTAHAVVAP